MNKYLPEQHNLVRVRLNVELSAIPRTDWTSVKLLPYLACYFKDISREDAIQRLQKCSPGTYLIRRSSEEGYYALSFKDDKNAIQQVLLKIYDIPLEYAKYIDGFQSIKHTNSNQAFIEIDNLIKFLNLFPYLKIDLLAEEQLRQNINKQCTGAALFASEYKFPAKVGELIGSLFNNPNAVARVNKATAAIAKDLKKASENALKK